MNSAANKHYLYKSITQVVPPYKNDKNIFCMRKQPCDRLIKCDFCWNKRFKFYQKQIETKVYDWKLSYFLTITIHQNLQFDTQTFRILKALRRDLTKSMSRKKCKYLMVLTLLSRSEEFSPHFHAIVSTVSKEALDRIVMKYFLHFKVHFMKITKGIGHFKRIFSYTLKMNLRPSLKAKLPKMQLFTASRGYYTGRPRYDLEKFAWLA